MDRRNRAAVNSRRSRRRMTLLWSAICAAIIIALLVMEQIAVLYVLATVGVAVLLIIVAMADLKGVHAAAAIQLPRDDAAAISDGIASASTQFTASSRGRAKNR